MSNMRSLRTRIKSAESTGKITKSMKMVSAAKLRRTQKSMLSLRPYADRSRAIMSRLVSGAEIQNPFLIPREVKKTCYVLFVGNRGLCGVYNSALLKYMDRLAQDSDGEFFTVVVGRWGKEQISALGIHPVKTFDTVSDTPDFAYAAELSSYLKELYLSGAADRIILVYQQFLSVLSQAPCNKTLLPVEKAEDGPVNSDYIFEPDRNSLIDSILSLYIDNTVYSALLEAKTGEHASRMTAMTSATDNTEELIASLSLKLNHARQAAITTEITEIVGGASALKS